MPGFKALLEKKFRPGLVLRAPEGYNGGIREGDTVLIGIICGASLLAALGGCWGWGLFEGLGWLWGLPLLFAGSFLVLAVLAFLLLWALCARVDLEKPQEKDSPFWRRLTAWYISAIKTVCRIRVHSRGLEQLPTQGRFLLVCNHLSNADPVLLLDAFPKSQLAFISKRENSTMFLVGKVMHKLQCQLLNRENDREALKTILKCIEMIREDRASIGVFPEGWCSQDGLLRHFRSGVFKIAQRTKVPIVVCTLQNTIEIFKNLPKLRPTQVQLHLVKVLQQEDYAGLSTVELGDHIYRLMADDLGPELVYKGE